MIPRHILNKAIQNAQTYRDEGAGNPLMKRRRLDFIQPTLGSSTPKVPAPTPSKKLNFITPPPAHAHPGPSYKTVSIMDLMGDLSASAENSAEQNDPEPQPNLQAPEVDVSNISAILEASTSN